VKFEGPTDAELAALAHAAGFDLSDEDRQIYGALLRGVLGAYALLDAEPDALPAPVGGERRWWVPDAADNPHNAWYVRSEISLDRLGPLAGCGVALKDNVMVAGLPMMNGSAALEGFVPELDATVVTRLLEAGAVILGKAHCEDLCLSAGSHTNATGLVHNPYRFGYSAGGSSSGSAVLVACGDVKMAIGGDQGGSIRVPSALCGTVGMKPSWGLVPYTGIGPIEVTIDHTGPITADVRDNARMLAVLAGPDGFDPRQQAGARAGGYVAALDAGVAGLRVGVLGEGFGHPNSLSAVDDSVRAAAERLARAGAQVVPCSVPMHRRASALTLPLLVEGMYRTVLRDDGQGVGRSDLYVPGYQAKMRRWREHAASLSPMVVSLGLAGAYIDREFGTRYYGKAVNLARRVRAAYDEAFASLDCLLMPTSPTTATPLPAPDAGIAVRVARAGEAVANTQPFDVSHHPAISVPCGMVDGLPVGAMLVGRHHEEATLYRLAQSLEQSEDWRRC
jgi:amidase